MGFQISNGVLKKYTEEKGVTEIVIPDGVQRIGERAFSGCDNITNVTIPRFGHKYRRVGFLPAVATFENITIPNSVTKICVCTFEWCDKLTSVTIPRSVTSISDGAFSNCTCLKNVTIRIR